jgi:excisionase family DNA binding protein
LIRVDHPEKVKKKLDCALPYVYGHYDRSDQIALRRVRAMDFPKAFYSVEEVAELFGISVRTAWVLISKRRIPGGFRLGGQWRISGRALQDYVNRGADPAANASLEPATLTETETDSTAPTTGAPVMTKRRGRKAAVGG